MIDFNLVCDECYSCVDASSISVSVVRRRARKDKTCRRIKGKDICCHCKPFGKTDSESRKSIFTATKMMT